MSSEPVVGILIDIIWYPAFDPDTYRDFSTSVATLLSSFCLLFSNSVASDSYRNYPDTELTEVEGSHTSTPVPLRTMRDFVRYSTLFTNSESSDHPIAVRMDEKIYLITLLTRNH
jgi:hypothetical protein